jgi:hypothetical protein
MRQEPGGVEAEVVIARTPRNGRCRCTVDNEGVDAMLMLELTRDSETGGACPDHNDIAVVLDMCGHRDVLPASILNGSGMTPSSRFSRQ